MYKKRMHINKEPWLAGSLSWLIPGIGHIYSASFGRGICLIFLAGLLHVFCIASLISTRTLIFLPILLNLCGIIVLPIYASLDAFRLTRGRNTEDFESERTLSKDPWLAVFLSVVLPGLGHIYLHKHIVGILFLLSFWVLRVISQTNYYALFTIFVLRAFVSVHAYIVCSLHKFKLKQPLTLFIITLLCLCFFKSFLLPQLEKHYLVQTSKLLKGSSMAPTIVKGDLVIVDKFTYSWRDPKPGDIIEFTLPKKVPSNSMIPASKRIIAVGGETIHIRYGDVYVDGQERKIGVQAGRYEYPDSSLPLDFYGERDNPYLAYGVHEPYRVPEGHYFVLGDNRMYSADSRYFGAIPRGNIIGKVVKIYWPPRRMGIVQ